MPDPPPPAPIFLSSAILHRRDWQDLQAPFSTTLVPPCENMAVFVIPMKLTAFLSSAMMARHGDLSSWLQISPLPSWSNSDDKLTIQHLRDPTGLVSVGRGSWRLVRSGGVGWPVVVMSMGKRMRANRGGEEFFFLIEFFNGKSVIYP